MMSKVMGLVVVVFCVLASWWAMAEDDVLDALEAVNRQLAQKPNDPALLVQRSQLYTLKAQYDLAIADLNQADQVSGLATLQFEKAKLFLTAGWSETGLEHANRYVASNPDDSQGYLIRARLLSKLNRLPESANDYFKVLEKNRDTTLDIFIEGAKALTTEDGAHLPAAMKVADMRPKNPGIWMYHCHVNDHMLEGMSARYEVLPGSDTTPKRTSDKAVANATRPGDSGKPSQPSSLPAAAKSGK